MQVFTEEQAERLQLRRARRDEDRPRGAGAGQPVGKLDAQSQSRQLLRRDRAGRVLHGAHRARHRLQRTIRCCAGRIHSYVDTQISRLGGPNFHEIPINAPVAQVHNNQRDGMHRQAINRGRVAYEPNSLGGGCPFQAGVAGFTSFPQPIEDDKVRGKPEKFADHYTQATLFYHSQTPVEQEHIMRAFRFELTKVQVPAVRERVVAMLRNVDEELAASVAERSRHGHCPSRCRSLIEPPAPEVEVSPALSLFARPGDGSIADAARRHPGRRRRRCRERHGDPRGPRGARRGTALRRREARHGRRGGRRDDRGRRSRSRPCRRCCSTRSSFPDGDAAAKILGTNGQAVEFIVNAYRHCKPILALGAGRSAGRERRRADDAPVGRARSGPAAVRRMAITKTRAAGVRRRDREASSLRTRDGSASGLTRPRHSTQTGVIRCPSSGIR